MSADKEQNGWIAEAAEPNHPCLQKFRLYETRSNFYMIGRDKSRSIWRVLKIYRLEPSELNILEDCTTYSETECCDLLRRIDEGNLSTGGLKFVSTCYGIVGFIKFLGPYYMLLITKRRKIGAICGHAVYTIAKSRMIPVPNSTVWSNLNNSKDENRYRKLLCSVDLTKDFFFSYSYHVMHSLQKNLCKHEIGQIPYETMFVWNEFLTRGVRYHLKNTLWTVALVYGFFKQVKLSISGREFKLTLIARRSRHYAGTRYLKRGVNEKGRVANDVETEQIVFEDVPEEFHMQISSVVQNRGSIPLFWSQESSRLNIKPDIMLSKKDHKYQATRLHFENLLKRYGNPIIVLNLLKTHEKKPRESILRAEFAYAIAFLNKDLAEENRLKFLHWDLNKYSKRKSVDVLLLLRKVAAYALNLTSFFYCQVAPTSETKVLPNLSCLENSNSGDPPGLNLSDTKKDANVETRDNNNGNDEGGHHFVKPPMFQKGVLRTNCIDCLDRTNVAQYAYGLVALCHQLHALGIIDDPNIDMDSPLAYDLMRVYETMGDTLALQYGGSAAHNKGERAMLRNICIPGTEPLFQVISAIKVVINYIRNCNRVVYSIFCAVQPQIFSQRRGQWIAATQSQEFFRTLQRYYNNAYMDAEKQDAINVFLGHFQPQQGKPALWELDSDQHYNIGKHGSDLVDENARSSFKRSLSEGNIFCESNLPIDATDVGINEYGNQSAPGNAQAGNKGLSESTPAISICDDELSYSRYTPSMSSRQLFPDMQLDRSLLSDCTCFDKCRGSCDCSNLFDVEWVSSSGNSCEEDAYERSTLLSSPVASGSLDSIVTGSNVESAAPASESGSSMKGSDLAEFSDSFVRWVNYGEMFCR